MEKKRFAGIITHSGIPSGKGRLYHVDVIDFDEARNKFADLERDFQQLNFKLFSVTNILDQEAGDEQILVPLFIDQVDLPA